MNYLHFDLVESHILFCGLYLAIPIILSDGHNSKNSRQQEIVNSCTCQPFHIRYKSKDYNPVMKKEQNVESRYRPAPETEKP